MSARFAISCSGGEVSSTLHTASGIIQLDAPRPFTSPLSPGESEDLTWYYESYPINAGPSGHFRAARIEARLPAMGVALFDAIFPKASEAREAWEQNEHEDLSLWLTGVSSKFLSLPWELARVSDSADPIGQRNRVTRALVPSRQLDPVRLRSVRRVLLVISRPDNSPKISFLLFARDLLSQVAAASGEVALEVLRPPTFEAFCARIRAAEEEERPFDIVHFDGHGSIARPDVGGESVAYIIFESPNGAPRPVSGAALLAGLAGARIPLFVLAACHSGEVASSAGAESSVATALMSAGTATAVVAMSYAICAEAAKVFLDEFYRAVLQGRPLAQAVADGRRQLALSPRRHLEHGLVNMQDWAIPVFYAHSAVAFDPPPKSTATLERTAKRLVGREAECFELERRLRVSGSVVLDGLVGGGKTALASDFADWMAATSPGRPSPVMVDASACATLANLGPIPQLNETTGGPIVIDGLEVVHRWSPADRSRLFAQVTARPHPRPALIMVGRGLAAAAEGTPCLTLAPIDEESLRNILPVEIEATNAVLQFLDGHSACALAAGPPLQNGFFPVELGDEALVPVRSALAALGDVTSRQLRLIAGHGPRLEFQTLKHLTGYFQRSREPGTPQHDELAETLGLQGVEDSRYEDWTQIIERCCGACLAQRIAGDIYRLHPGLGPALVKAWQAEVGELFDSQWKALRDRVDHAVLAAAAQLSWFMPLGTGLSQHPLSGPLRLIDPTYVRAQMRALEPRIKLAILRSIARDRVLQAGLGAQALTILSGETGTLETSFSDTVLTQLRAEYGPKGAAEARMLRFVCVQQLALSRRPSVVDPEAELHEMLAEPEEWGEIGLGITIKRPKLLLLLAITLDNRGRPAEALPLAHEAVALLEESADRNSLAEAKHSLATILRNLGRNAAAHAVSGHRTDDLALTPTRAMEFAHQRAIEAFDIGDREAATQLQVSNVTAAQDNPRHRARAMHEFGVISFAEDRLAEAEDWFLKSLAIKESHFPPLESVRTLQSLGALALRRKRDDEAGRWFLRVLDAAGTLQSVASEARICLAAIAARRGDADAALDGVLQAFSTYIEHGMHESGAVLAKAHEVLQSTTADRVVAHWRKLKAADLSAHERLSLAECFARVRLRDLSADLSAPLRSSTEPSLAARALLLQGESLLKTHQDADALTPGSEALSAADASIAHLETLHPLTRALTRTYGAALGLKAAILCSYGNKTEGAEFAVRSIEALAAFREGPEIEGLFDYARINNLLGMVYQDLGRWTQATQSYLAAAEAYRLCSAGNSWFLPYRFTELYHAIQCQLRAGDATGAISQCAVLRQEMSRSLPGPKGCAANPAMGEVVQITLGALSAVGDREGERRLIADRWAEIDSFIDAGGPGVLREYTSWSLALLQMAEKPDETVAIRLRDILLRSSDLDGFRPEHSVAMSQLIWQCLQDRHTGIAEALRVALTDLDRRLVGRSDISAAAARADFDSTLGQGLATTAAQDEALAARLSAGVTAEHDPLTALRLGFAIQHAVAKRLKGGQLQQALQLAQGLEDLVMPHAELHEVCRDAFFACRRNLVVVLGQARDWKGAVAQIERILEIAVSTGEGVTFVGAEYDATKSDKDLSAGNSMVRAVGNAMAGLAEAKEIAVAARLLLACIETVVVNPTNDLVIAAAFAGCSNLLMRVRVPMQSTREIYARLLEARHKRTNSALLDRAFSVGAMDMVFTERTQGDISSARAAFAQLVQVGDRDGISVLVAQAGLGLAKDLGGRGDVQGMISVMASMLPAICCAKGLGPAIDDLAGGVDFCISKCLESHDFVTGQTLLDAARTLREKYSDHPELNSTVAIGIANLLGHASSAGQFRGWWASFRELAPALPAPDRAQILSVGTANAILGAADHGLADVADSLYRELSQLLGAGPKHRPPMLIAAFLNRITVLRRFGQLDQALDELLDAAVDEANQTAWLTALAEETAELINESWTTSDIAQRDKLSKLTHQLLKDREAHTILRSRLDKTMLQAIEA